MQRSSGSRLPRLLASLFVLSLMLTACDASDLLALTDGSLVDQAPADEDAARDSDSDSADDTSDDATDDNVAKTTRPRMPTA